MVHKRNRDANPDIHDLLDAAHFTYWQVADKIGICEGTLMMWLRHPLTGDHRARVLRAINELKEEI